MASAQVMRKQEHLEAGKRTLEEFRKKKAARAKKTAQSSKTHASNGDLHNQLPETGQVRATDSDGAGTSGSVGGAGLRPSGGSSGNEVTESNVSSSSVISTNHSFPYNHNDNKPLVPDLPHSEDKELGSGGSLEFANQVNTIYSHQEKKEDEASGSAPSEMERGQFMSSHLLSIQETSSNSSNSNNYGFGFAKVLTNNNDSQLKDNLFKYPDASYSTYVNVSPERSISVLGQEKSGSPYQLDNSKSIRSSSNEGPARSTITNHFSGIGKHTDAYGSLGPTSAESKLAGSGAMFGELSSSSLSSDRFAGLGFGSTPPTPGNNRRSRPSFLDSINIPKGPPSTPSLSESVKADPFGSKVHSMDFLQSSVDGATSQKQNEDFAALEQHIEDLTQEKFSLQRALEASRTLAESLAAENSTLTDSYNQQGSIVAQLKSDMQRLQEEIKALLTELEAVKLEYANAQLECNAADERGKLLASEVIGLEEKALRLRSNELKLERELESRQADVSSLKKKMSSLEKERHDLLSTIDALQEEKKLLQSKLWKASTSGKLANASKSTANKKDVSVSTVDLVEVDDDASNTDTMSRAISSGSHASGSPSLNEDRQFNLEELSMTVPPDQMRMIQNINTIISELAMEKEELVQALSTELFQSTKLKELNKELTRKLEAQTQRMELLTSQSMAGEIVPVKQMDSRNLHDSITYADEGDEVVERVLGWIMKLFPGGPSRRRTGKLH